MTRMSEEELNQRLRSDDVPKENTLWKHKKSKSVYRVVGICLLEENCETAVLYRREGAQYVLWCRPLDSFLDKFEKLNTNSVPRT